MGFTGAARGVPNGRNKVKHPSGCKARFDQNRTAFQPIQPETNNADKQSRSMTNRNEKRRYARRKPFASQRDLNVRAIVDGASVHFPAKLIDIGSGGLSIELPQVVEPGSILHVSGAIEDLRGSQALEQRCHVRFCRPAAGGRFVIGLSYEVKKEAEATTSADYYETLQLSRNADFDTIQRVFRILAQRYHPDNQETGNHLAFQQIMEAHRVLSDPARRAAYDLQTKDQSPSRFKLFDSWQDTQGPEAERRIRRGILTILYRQRQTNPRLPEVSLMDLADALGVPREHLEFSLWFLRESKSIKSGDSGRIEITHTGVLVAEADEHHGPGGIHPMRSIEAASHT